MTNDSCGTYEDLAREYYDPSRHPTCANFRQASAILFRKWNSSLASGLYWSCEIGPGKSLLAEFMSLEEFRSARLLLIDSSPSMLEHSKAFSVPGQTPIIGAATALPLKQDSTDFVASFLGDPYNVSKFWREVFRVLKPGGQFVFTTPSYEWASAFREGLAPEMQTTAEFVLADGRRIFVPSFVLPEERQLELIESSNFRILDIASVRVSDLGEDGLSPKLMVKRSKELVVVSGYLCGKSQEAAK